MHHDLADQLISFGEKMREKGPCGRLGMSPLSITAAQFGVTSSQTGRRDAPSSAETPKKKRQIEADKASEVTQNSR